MPAKMDTLMQARTIQANILRLSKQAGVGHIGSALSIVDILVALFDHVIHAEVGNPDRDRFILSKGHAALALYCVLHEQGILSREQLDTYCQDNTILGVHPKPVIPGVDFATGSLGQGLGMAVGAALAARIQRSKRRVYCLMSDAELNEGSVWEALLFAKQHKLNHLTVILDDNGQQALGKTQDVLHIQDLPSTLNSLGWVVNTVDGHDIDALTEALKLEVEGPHFIIAKTALGKGVSFMEKTIEWHYKSMSDEQYERALKDIGHA